MLLNACCGEPIAKAAPTSERVRVQALLVRQENRIRKAVILFMQQVRSTTVTKQIYTLLADNNIEGAVKLVSNYITALGRVLPQAFIDVANSETTALGDKFRRASLRKARSVTVRVGVGFDASNDRAARLMRQSQLKFIQEFTEAQRDSVRQALAITYRNGGSTRDAVNAFKNSLGLTKYQVDMVESYRVQLEKGSARALERTLRDKRTDRTVIGALNGGAPLKAARINHMVERYRANLLSLRAQTIALTEGLGVVSEARHEATKQAAEQMGFSAGDVVRRWRATQDHRTRDSHFDMDGQEVGLEEPFIAPSGERIMYPGDPRASAKERIRCRCDVETDIR